MKAVNRWWGTLGVCRWTLIACVAWSNAARADAADYTAIDLYPLSGLTALEITGQTAVSGTVVGGGIVMAMGAPVFWDGTGNVPVDLAPTNLKGLTGAVAEATNGRQQTGYGFFGSAGSNIAHALLWNGTGASAVDLNPTNLSGFANSYARGVSDTQQVGSGYGPATYGQNHALLWTGSADSAVDLNPSGFTESEALAANGTQQVGDGFTGGHPHAVLWQGTAASAVDLNPSGYIETSARGTSGSQQVGYGNPGMGGHAMLWNGSASSAVDLQPLTGFRGSMAFGTNGVQQVGLGTTMDGRSQALVWSGTAASVVNLSTLLPARLFSAGTGSEAVSIDSAGDVFGIADSPNGEHAVEWVPHPVLPGDSDLDGAVGLDDLVTLARHFSQPGGWVSGDFNMDGSVGFDDLVMLARNYGQTLTAAQLEQFNPSLRSDIQTAFANTPEPSIALAFLPVAALLVRSRR